MPPEMGLGDLDREDSNTRTMKVAEDVVCYNKKDIPLRVNPPATATKQRPQIMRHATLLQ
jgi:hypothetical protein